MAGVAAGLLIGTTFRALSATLLALAVSGALVAVAFLVPLSAIPLPLGGLALLTHLDSAARPVAGSLQSAGAALTAAAVLLILAAAGLERSDL
jgi:hypothetical protein